MEDEITFDVRVTMKKRWVPHFLSMLNYMQRLGSLGGSRMVSFFADGDGDFRPKFRWNEKLMKDPVKPVSDDDGNHIYDAG